MSREIGYLKLKGVALLALMLVGLLQVYSVYVSAQSTGLKIQWSKTYGPGGSSSVVQTQDGGFLIVGANATRLTNTIFTMYNYTSLLIKTNSSAEVEWIKTYPGTSGIDWIMQTTDLGYLLLDRGSYSGWLLKTDSHGNLEWNRTIDLQQIMGFTIAEDGSYVIAGYADNQATAYSYAVVIRYDENGDLIWQKGFQGDKVNIAATVILQSNDSSGFYVAGSHAQDFWFIKLDSSGSIVWNQTYHFQDIANVSSPTFYSIAKTQDGGFILTGTDGKYTWLVKTDSTGKEQWHQRYDYDNFISVVQEKNGQYIGFGKFQLISMDIYGNEIFNESYNSAENSESSRANFSNTYAASGIVSNDGGIVVVGSVNYLINDTYDVWAAKFAPLSVPNTSPSIPEQPAFAVIAVSIILTTIIIFLKLNHKKKKLESVHYLKLRLR